MKKSCLFLCAVLYCDYEMHYKKRRNIEQMGEDIMDVIEGVCGEVVMASDNDRPLAVAFLEEEKHADE